MLNTRWTSDKFPLKRRTKNSKQWASTNWNWNSWFWQSKHSPFNRFPGRIRCSHIHFTALSITSNFTKTYLLGNCKQEEDSRWNANMTLEALTLVPYIVFIVFYRFHHATEFKQDKKLTKDKCVLFFKLFIYSWSKCLFIFNAFVW